MSTTPNSTHISFDVRLAALAGEQHGIFSADDLARLGAHPRLAESRVRCGRWVRVVPGVYRLAGAPDTWESQLAAGLAWLGPKAAVSHRSAAALYHLDGFEPGPVELLVPSSVYRRRGSPWTVRTTGTLPARDVLSRRGFPVTSASRTLVDLAGTNITDKLIGLAIDSAIHQGFTTFDHLVERHRALRQHGRKGSVRLDVLLLDSGGHSILEREFLRLMRVNGIPAPRPQVTHRLDSGKVIRVDFEWAEVPLVVEVSGRWGHSSVRERDKDARRINELQERGRTVLEFTSLTVRSDPQYVVATVRAHLARLHG
jgi:very-short-patch-repair endonuclease